MITGLIRYPTFFSCTFSPHQRPTSLRWAEMILCRKIKIGRRVKSMAQASMEIGLGNSAQTFTNLCIHSSSAAWQKEYACGILRGFLLAGSLRSPRCLITVHSPYARSDGRRSPGHIVQPPRHPIMPKPHLKTITSPTSERIPTAQSILHQRSKSQWRLTDPLFLAHVK